VKPGIPQPQAPVVKKSPLPPEERLEELMVDKMEPKKEAERLFSFTLRDEEIGQLLLALSRQIPYNIVVDPDISGTVTVDLKDVTLEEALDTFTSLLGLEYKVKVRLSGYSDRRWRPGFSPSTISLPSGKAQVNLKQ
jgi:MSHA biogenesis protein MshL